jgi:hypothetical protein
MVKYRKVLKEAQGFLSYPCDRSKYRTVYYPFYVFNIRVNLTDIYKILYWSSTGPLEVTWGISFLYLYILLYIKHKLKDIIFLENGSSYTG